MSTVADIDVLVSDNTAVDLVLFEYWLDGYSGELDAPNVFISFHSYTLITVTN